MIEARPGPGAAFQPDAAFVTRITELSERVGAAVEEDVAAIVADPTRGPLDGSTVSHEAAADLITRHALASVVELALLTLPVAGAMARPPISGFEVAAVGIEGESGDLVLGANLEFPGSELTSTIHAEGFVALRARRRARTLDTLVLRSARPCAHCRQTLAESAAADGLTLVDMLGHAVTLEDLYPWPFQPKALGVDGDVSARVGWPDLALAGAASPPDVASALLDAGAHAHAPYSGSPSAVVLRAGDGRLVGAGCVESVAFNPSISALQAALVELVAARIDPAGIAEGWLACGDGGGAVDPEPGFRALVRAVAPHAVAHVARWATGR